MNQIVEDGAIIVLASPVGREATTIWNDKLFPTRLKIWKIYAGKANKYESVRTPNSSCALHIPLNQTTLIIGKRSESRTLMTSLCDAGGFSKDQWLTYLETGKETPPRDKCWLDIKQAYDAEISLGEFNLEQPECKIHIPDYNEKFQIQP